MGFIDFFFEHLNLFSVEMESILDALWNISDSPKNHLQYIKPKNLEKIVEILRIETNKKSNYAHRPIIGIIGNIAESNACRYSLIRYKVIPLMITVSRMNPNDSDLSYLISYALSNLASYG